MLVCRSRTTQNDNKSHEDVRQIIPMADMMRETLVNIESIVRPEGHLCS